MISRASLATGGNPVAALGPILAALIWGGCHLVFPFEMKTEADGPPSLDAEVGPPADLKLGDGDAPISLTMEIEVPQPPEVRVGRHVPVVLVLSGHQGSVAVQAVASGGCLLALPGKARAVESIKVEQPSPGKLVTHLFAPPGVKPGTQCSVKFAIPGMKPSVTLTVTEPANELLFLQSDAISGMEGLKVTHLGELQHGGRIRAMVVAGGMFGGDFVVGTDWRDSTGNPMNPSTVRLYRFKGDPSQPKTILPALDLYGKSTNPTVLDGLAWSDRGPCKPDALYLGASDRDYKYGTDQYNGSVSCVTSDLKTPQLLVNDKRAKAVAVVPTQGFFPKADIGSVIFSTDSTTYLYPGYHIVDFIGDGTNQMIFAPVGLHKGHLYMIKSFPPSYPLLRISPPPGQKETILHPSSNDSRIRFTLSAGGTFGPLVVTAVPGTQSEYYHVVALVEEGGGVHEVTLLQEVPCGRFIMDPKGNYLVLLAPPSDKVCTGPWSIYRLEFDLP